MKYISRKLLNLRHWELDVGCCESTLGGKKNADRIKHLGVTTGIFTRNLKDFWKNICRKLLNLRHWELEVGYWELETGCWEESTLENKIMETESKIWALILSFHSHELCLSFLTYLGKTPYASVYPEKWLLSIFTFKNA